MGSKHEEDLERRQGKPKTLRAFDDDATELGHRFSGLERNVLTFSWYTRVELISGQKYIGDVPW